MVQLRVTKYVPSSLKKNVREQLNSMGTGLLLVAAAKKERNAQQQDQEEGRRHINRTTESIQWLKDFTERTYMYV